jgi:hypothetical protein
VKEIGEQVTANIVPETPILLILMMEATLSSETSSVTRATRHHIPEDGIIRFILTSTDFVFLTPEGAEQAEISLWNLATVKSRPCVYSPDYRQSPARPCRPGGLMGRGKGRVLCWQLMTNGVSRGGRPHFAPSGFYHN